MECEYENELNAFKITVLFKDLVDELGYFEMTLYDRMRGRYVNRTENKE